MRDYYTLTITTAPHAALLGVYDAQTKYKDPDGSDLVDGECVGAGGVPYKVIGGGEEPNVYFPADVKCGPYYPPTVFLMVRKDTGEGGDLSVSHDVAQLFAKRIWSEPTHPVFLISGYTKGKPRYDNAVYWHAYQKPIWRGMDLRLKRAFPDAELLSSYRYHMQMFFVGMPDFLAEHEQATSESAA